jgi:uncharacterized protein
MSTARRVLATVAVALLGATLLNSASLEASADRMELGPRRDLALAVVGPVAQVSAALRADRPHLAVRRWLGKDEPRALRGLPVSLTADAPSALPVAETPPDDRDYLDRLAREQLGVRCEPTLPPLKRRAVEPDQPLRVLLIGDSLMEHLGPPVQQDLGSYGSVDVELDWHYSTGLSRPDYFDWPLRMRTRLASAPPDAVVILFGGNDGQNLKVDGRTLRTATPAWNAEYGRRVQEFVDLLVAQDVFVYWIGLPNMRDPPALRKAQAMNHAFERPSRDEPRVRFVSTWELFSDAEGRYAEYLPDETGRRRMVRAGDGIHFTKDGARRLSRALAGRLERDWALDGWWLGDDAVACGGGR